MFYIYACSKHMFQVFSGVSYVCLQVFHLHAAYVYNGFSMFLGIFASVLDICFKCFIDLLLYVATVAYVCFKSRSGVAHGMRVESGWWRGRRSERHGRRSKRCRATACLLAREPTR